MYKRDTPKGRFPNWQSLKITQDVCNLYIYILANYFKITGTAKVERTITTSKLSVSLLQITQ